MTENARASLIFFLYLFIIPLFVFSAGCGSSRSYYQRETSGRKYHVVKKGDTLYSISRRYNVSVKRLIEYNRIKSSKAIEPGQRIYLPSDQKTESQKIPSVKFGWPLKGKLTSKFGMRFGIPHKGIDIAAPFGTKVLAAYDGEVALVESRPRGLGNVIILKHEKDFMTVYGHNSKILVKEEQRVKKGQPISLVGSSGWSTGSHLHFEIRYKGEALDPLDYLP